MTSRVLVAPDKFAGTLTAVAAATAIADGWRRTEPGDEVSSLPLADGGPGFLTCLAAALGGVVHTVATTGPLGEPAVARLLLVETGSGRTAYVEAADVCGLHLLSRPSPSAATTVGLAPVLLAAVASGADRVVVGVGGTASTDGGRGVVEALGGTWPAGVGLVAATDVAAPLLGPTGAARGFGPQKGADADTVARLEARLAAWADETDGDRDAAGAGAGGGLGYGLELLGAHRVSGARLVADQVRLDERLSASDVVVTGEGRLDWSSLQGKVVGEVAERASTAQRRCLVLAGQVCLDALHVTAAGIDRAWSVTELLGSADAALARGAEGLTELAALAAGAWRQPVRPWTDPGE